MAFEFLPATPHDRAALVAFLLDAFQLPAHAPFVSSDLLRWKYDEPRPDWSGPRSYVMKDGARIVAHACLCPVTFETAAGAATSNHLIDWAGARDAPGSGMLLLRKLAAFSETLLAEGGSPQTQQMLPKLGYTRHGDLLSYVRVIRPWLQFRTDPARRGWKAPLRLARSAIWSLASTPAVPAAWAVTPVTQFDVLPAIDAGASFVAPRRSPELLNYMLRCPRAHFSAGLLSRGGVPSGWFVLSRVGGQGRIADISVNSQLPEDWQAAYALATREAAAAPEVCEVAAQASFPLAAEALERNGFHLRNREPIFLFDPRKKLTGAAPLGIQMIDWDAAYLHNPEYPYLS